MSKRCKVKGVKNVKEKDMKILFGAAVEDRSFIKIVLQR